MRELSYLEKFRLSKLTSFSVEATLIQPTKTGLKKSILDATSPVRNYLFAHNIHNYKLQDQGPNNKVIISAYFLSEDSVTKSTASLYRPKTKKGDPRIWFRRLQYYCKPNDILAIIAYKNELYLINLSRVPLEEIIGLTNKGPIFELIVQINKDSTAVALELLSKLRKIAQSGPVQSIMHGKADTAIGRTLETLLGIAINSSRKPDYKGIELKSYRSGKKNRKNLFGKVPNWELSKFKSSREILEHFGYESGDDFKLYCTVSSKSYNSQGLKFRLDQDLEQLIENSNKEEINDFAVWVMSDLREALSEKHNETFWVAANSMKIHELEHFQFTKVRHTRKPILSQFDILLDQGDITMDHLIKKDSKGKVSEKGPLFKINEYALEMLFPPPKIYDLLRNDTF